VELGSRPRCARICPPKGWHMPPWHGPVAAIRPDKAACGRLCPHKHFFGLLPDGAFACWNQQAQCFTVSQGVSWFFTDSHGVARFLTTEGPYSRDSHDFPGGRLHSKCKMKNSKFGVRSAELPARKGIGHDCRARIRAPGRAGGLASAAFAIFRVSFGCLSPRKGRGFASFACFRVGGNF
jgi:hypothetical protein